MTEPHFSRNPDVARRTIAEETFLLPIKGELAALESLFVLDEVGAFIWDALAEEPRLEDVARAVESHFEVAPEQARQDAHAFLDELERASLVRRVEA